MAVSAGTLAGCHLMAIQAGTFRRPWSVVMGPEQAASPAGDTGILTFEPVTQMPAQPGVRFARIGFLAGVLLHNHGFLLALVQALAGLDRATGSAPLSATLEPLTSPGLSITFRFELWKATEEPALNQVYARNATASMSR